MDSKFISNQLGSKLKFTPNKDPDEIEEMHHWNDSMTTKKMQMKKTTMNETNSRKKTSKYY